MNEGYITLRLTAFDGALPVIGASISIFDMDGNMLKSITTDGNGVTERIELPGPPVQTQFDPSSQIKPYTPYIIDIIAQNYRRVVIKGVQIFGESSSTLPVNMMPGDPSQTDEFDIGLNAIETGSQSGRESAPPTLSTGRIHREVFIPTHIRVHLGRPGANARILTVPFIDYIKNVASSEIYPSWPYHSLRANIHAQISLALNRVFTEWYRGKGYNFDITNSTQFDQYFVENRNIYDSVSVIADEIFNTYILRPPGIEPYFAEYCNGTTATCPGMKQWGTVDLEF